MLHIKFQGHRSIGFGGDVFTIYGHGDHVGNMTQLICINFHPHSPLSFPMTLVPNRPSVSEKNKF